LDFTEGSGSWQGTTTDIYLKQWMEDKFARIIGHCPVWFQEPCGL